MPRVYIGRHASGVSFGCLGSLVYGFGVLLLAVLVITLLAYGLLIATAIGVVVLAVLGAVRLVQALSPKRRAQRAIDACVVASRPTTGGVSQEAIDAAQRREDKWKRRDSR